MTLPEMALRLALSILIGGLVGFERERRDRPAGLRTHILVCMGSTLITVVSRELASGRADPTRIAAQIVSGIGFLGAGTIFRSGNSIRGLTTAAGLWVVAGIGMGLAADGNVPFLAGLAGVAVFVVNRWLRMLEDRLIRDQREVRLRLGSGAVGPVLEGLAERGVRVEGLQWLDDQDGQPVLWLGLRLPQGTAPDELTRWISTQAGVTRVEWE